MDNKDMVKIFKALGDENRLRILELIGSNEVCACKLLEHLDIGQPTLSHHMKILSECGIVEGRKDGKWVHYKINKEIYEKTAAYMGNILKTGSVNTISCSNC